MKTSPRQKLSNKRMKDFTSMQEPATPVDDTTESDWLEQFGPKVNHLQDRVAEILKQHITSLPTGWQSELEFTKRAEGISQLAIRFLDHKRHAPEFSLDECLQLAIFFEQQTYKNSATRLLYEVKLRLKHNDIDARGMVEVLADMRKESKARNNDHETGPLEHMRSEARAEVVQNVKERLNAVGNVMFGASSAEDVEKDATNNAVKEEHDEAIVDNGPQSDGSQTEGGSAAEEEAPTPIIQTATPEDGVQPSQATPVDPAEPATTTQTTMPPSQDPMQMDEVVPEPKPLPTATLDQLILDAKRDTTKKSSNKRDVAVITNAEDLGHTILLASCKLFHASNLQDVAVSIHPAAVEHEYEIKYIFLLEAHGDSINMPKLTPLRGDITGQQLLDGEFAPYSAIWETAARVKDEHPDDSETAVSRPDWIKAYGALLAIIDSPSTIKSRLDEDAAKALPRLEAILNIAQSLGALATIKDSFDRQTIKYISNQTLYPAIAREAASWLLIGSMLHSEIIYKEAFRHVAGSFPAWPWVKAEQAIPANSMANIQKRSKDLRNRRDRVDLELLLICPTKDHSIVALSASPAEYRAGNIFTDWIREHLIYLQQSEVGAPPRSYTLLETDRSRTCRHDGECRTVAGFYRTLARGGDAYLPADAVIEAEYTVRGRERLGNTDANMRRCLTALKMKAAMVVAPMTKSGMQFARRDELEYLCCAEVGAEGMPWGGEGEASGVEDVDKDGEMDG